MKEVENAEPKDDVNVDQECQQEHDNLSDETDKNQKKTVETEENVKEKGEEVAEEFDEKVDATSERQMKKRRASHSLAAERRKKRN